MMKGLAVNAKRVAVGMEFVGRLLWRSFDWTPAGPVPTNVKPPESRPEVKAD